MVSKSNSDFSCVTMGHWGGGGKKGGRERREGCQEGYNEGGRGTEGGRDRQGVGGREMDDS